MSDQKVYYCLSCGAPLSVAINREFVFCQYCGTKNVIESQGMKTKINLNGMNIEAKTDVDSMINSAEYCVSIGNYDKANEMLNAAIISGTRDYRVFIVKAKIDLLIDDNKSLFYDIDTLMQMEQQQSSKREVTAAVNQLMHFRGKNGVTVLHNATFHEDINKVAYCVAHGSDVNCVAGMNRVTPISIMFVPISRELSKLDGTPFIRDKRKVSEIRRYLMSCGARDIPRKGY